jgi:uracil-DNA glycosylase
MPTTLKARDARLGALADQICVCTKCPLHESRTIAVPGDGTARSKFMIIGEAPGKDEDETGHPFVGASGRFLDHMLEGSGIDRGDFFITNTVKCRPPKNRTPKKSEIVTCTTNYLFEQIELVDPALVMLLGRTAATTILGVKNLNDARNQVIEKDGRRYIVGYHPAARFYREEIRAKVDEDFALLVEETQRAAGGKR